MLIAKYRIGYRLSHTTFNQSRIGLKQCLRHCLPVIAVKRLECDSCVAAPGEYV